MAIKSTLARGLQRCVGNLCKREDLSDFTIVVEDTSFSCHRVILSACSGFFHGLFRSQMKESLEGRAKLNSMKKGTFEIIINSIYKGTDGLTADTVLDVWTATHLLQIDYLIKECKQFVIHNLSVDNCFRFLNHATTYSAQEVIDSCLVFISKNFEQTRNVESFLQLPLDYFYKVIESDILATSSEDSVVDAILTWMVYPSDPEHCSWLYRGTLDEKAADEILSVAGISTYSVAITGGQDNRCDDQGNENIGQNNEKNDQGTRNYDQENDADDIVKENIDQSAAFVIRHDENNRISDCCENRVEPKSNIMTSEGNKTMCSKNSASLTHSKEADRKQHFLKLISACRLFLAKPTCLENLLKNHRDVLISTGAYDLVLKALMYSVSVELRHEAWPEAAVHRASSAYKHVMVFLSGNTLKAYSLDSGSVHEFAKVPSDCKNSNKIIVFDNFLYLVYHSNDGRIISSMITKQKSWAPVTGLNIYSSEMILAHGNYVYHVDVSCDQFKLSRWSYAHGRSEWKWMTQATTTPISVNILIRFQMYIVVITTQKNRVTAHCFNTETNKVHVCTTSMDATSKGMISFSSNEDVYVLEGNGSLWKIFSTDTTPVGFKLVSKLWKFNCDLNGCVLYRKKMYIFHNNKPTIYTEQKYDYKTLLTSLPGIYDAIEMIQCLTSMQYLPMVLPGSWIA